MSIDRRAVLGLGLAAATATLTGCHGRAPSATPGSWRTPQPSAPGVGGAVVDPAEGGVVRPGAPPLAGQLTTVLRRYLQPTAENPLHPTYAGAVALAIGDGRPHAHVAVGEALRYGAGSVLLPPAERVVMRRDAIFDLASVTKVFTAILALQQVDRGRIDLDAPVVRYLPEFTGAGKSAVTVSMLLTHTSGLPVGAKVTGYATNAERWKAVLGTPLVAGAVPGRVFRYSSFGLMVVGKLVEKVTGLTLDQALRSGLTDPLGLRWTGFNPNTWLSAGDRATRLVATDARTSLGVMRGVVHDDVCRQLGGVAGHAGIFSTAQDVAVIGRLLLDGGTYGGTRILAESTVRRMLTNANPGLPAVDPDHPTRTSAHGLGVVLDQSWFMGRLAAPATFGHTGFTGTSLLVDPRRRLVLVLLTNRAHPNWSWANPDPARVAVANVVARWRPGS
ncbi:beta-lactamase family protein [Micromonospora phytophila]|uniref:serine hydrolase domain-containing protein n=1 Tax=Micromonospora phytophila TaxID=709888 RepID=UPI00202F76AA|nr:serine hydrolase domain-containing protein [Micromonospora phytophila]MCM0678777.1 beta-lactamase family protein [Micromonospora phytophila]